MRIKPCQRWIPPHPLYGLVRCPRDSGNGCLACDAHCNRKRLGLVILCVILIVWALLTNAK